MKNLVEELNSVEDLQSGITVTLVKNQLSKDSSFFARVKNRLATVKATLGLIAKKKGVDSNSVKNALSLYNDEVLELLSMGYAVKVLDLGVLQIKLRGSIKSKEEVSNLNNFSVEFTPSSTLSDAVKNLKIEAVLEVANEPEIKSVSDLWNKDKENSVTIGHSILVNGQNIKLNTDIDEVYFVPITASGVDDLDEENWIKVVPKALYANKPTSLEIYVPKELTAGKKYRLALRIWKAKDDNPKAFELFTKSEVLTALDE